jgi:hypothetical protein
VNTRRFLFVLLAPVFSVELAALTFPDWQAASFTTEQLDDAAISDANADPDGDGLANLAEYAFFSQPLVSDANPSPAISVVSGHLVITHRERHAMTDVSIRLQGSSTLANWITYNSVTEADRETFTGYGRSHPD